MPVLIFLIFNILNANNIYSFLFLGSFFFFLECLKYSRLRISHDLPDVGTLVPASRFYSLESTHRYVCLSVGSHIDVVTLGLLFKF